MRCAEFLLLYSDYRDELITDPLVREDVRRHLEECLDCARMNRALTRGVGLLRSREIEPSPDFRADLRRRLLRAAAHPGPAFAPGGLTASLLVAAAVALVALEGTTRPAAEPGVDIPERTPAVVVNVGVPFVGFAEAPRAALVREQPDTTPESDSVVQAATFAP